MKAALLLTLSALGLTLSKHHSHSHTHTAHKHAPQHTQWKKHGFLQEEHEIIPGEANEEKKGDGHLYIHLIAHSHDDVGWLKTVDGYFSGTSVDVQDANVESTLDTTIAELLKDPNRRYTQVEMKFFSMWWKDQTEETKSAVRALAKEGRLEFVNAGWSMHDEACTHYED